MLFGDDLVVMRGGGDLATGTIFRLRRAGFPVLVLELEKPLAIRRTVAVASAVIEGRALIEDLDAMLIDDIEVTGIFSTGEGMWAQVQTSQKDISYLLREGDLLYDGDVLRIDPTEVVFKQSINDPTALKPFREVVKKLQF